MGRNLGQSYSTSTNCGFIRFVGGPYDGDRAFEDHNRYSGYSFSHQSEQCTHAYVPEAIGRSWIYRYIGAYWWNAGEREYRSWGKPSTSGPSK